MPLTFDLPFPPSALRPNAHAHPWTRRRLARRWGNQVWMELRAQYGPPPLTPAFRRARLDLEAVYPSGAGVWDDDAVVTAAKSGRDQLARFGLIVDDGPRFLTLGSVTTTINRHAAHPYLRLTLTEQEPDHAAEWSRDG